MSPLELFRRNQKVAMTALILLAMFSFVVLPTISTAMRQGGPGMTDPVLAEVDGVRLTASRVGMFTRQHYNTVQFLQRLAQESMKRGSTPQVPGFSVNPQTGDIQGIGISMQPSDEMSIRTIQFADEARRQGLELDDTSIELWLDQFTGGTISQRDVFALLRKETSNRMGQPQLFDMLRKQLLASLYFRGSDATIGGANIATGGRSQTLSPLDHWRNFLKLNQNASIHAYGVLVSDYIDKTDEKPASAEIDAVYEEGKNRFPSPESADPGFRRRPTASFEYLVAEMQKFRDAELAKLPEEAIREEYERRLKGGDFVLPDLPTEQPPVETEDPAMESAEGENASEEPMTEEGDSAPSDSTTPDPENAATPAEDTDKDLEQVESFAKELEEASKLEPPMEQDETAAKPDAEPAPEPTEADAKKSETTEATEPENTPESTEPESTEPESTEPESTEPESTEPGEPGEGDQSSRELPTAVRLVTQNEDPQSEDPPATEPETTETAAADPPATEKETAQPSPTEGTAEPPSGAGEDTPSDSAEPASETENTDEESEPSEPSVMAFEEVKDQVARSMVEQDAKAAMQKALATARNQMRSYYQKAAISNDKDLQRPDLKKLAEELNLSHRVIGPHDPVSLADEPIAEALLEGTEFSRQSVPFTAAMFGVPGRIPEQPLFRPVLFVNLEAERNYLSWKTEATEAYTPELDEVREEVIDAIRVAQARKLAIQAAEEIAEKANGGEKLEDLIPEAKKDNYKQDLKPFTWLNTVGFMGITIGNVEELDSVGNEFMEAVFTKLDNRHVVAANMPGRVVYVIKRIEMQPSASDLRSIFKQPTERLLSQFMDDGSLMKVRQGFYEAIDEKTGFEFMAVEQ